MSDVEPKLTPTQIVMGIGVIVIVSSLAFAIRPEPEAPPAPRCLGKVSNRCGTIGHYFENRYV